MNNFFLRLLPATVLCVPWLALGQAGRADPAATSASSPALRYQSAFADYKPWQDAKPGDWRELNDKLGEQAAGGSGHAGHAMPGTPAAGSAPSPAASKPAMPTHGAHRMHGGKQ